MRYFDLQNIVIRVNDNIETIDMEDVKDGKSVAIFNKNNRSIVAFRSQNNIIEIRSKFIDFDNKLIEDNSSRYNIEYYLSLLPVGVSIFYRGNHAQIQ